MKTSDEKKWAAGAMCFVAPYGASDVYEAQIIYMRKSVDRALVLLTREWDGGVFDCDVDPDSQAEVAVSALFATPEECVQHVLDRRAFQVASGTRRNLEDVEEKIRAVVHLRVTAKQFRNKLQECLAAMSPKARSMYDKHWGEDAE